MGPWLGAFFRGTQAALKDQKLVTFESKKPVALTPYLSEQVWQVGVVFSVVKGSVSFLTPKQHVPNMYYGESFCSLVEVPIAFEIKCASNLDT